MTTALCLNCGELKLGAICPCSSCASAAPTDYILLGILFSDHHFPPDTLTEFGKIITHFRCKTGNDDLVFWSFIKFITEQHGNLVKAETPDEFLDEVQAIYQESELPKLTIGKVRPCG